MSSNRSSDPSSSHSAKPDIRQSNACPPLPTDATLFDKVVYGLGIGLGSGLPKRAPGTWGTLGGVIVALPLMQLGFIAFFSITLVSSVIGIAICERTSNLMQVHDDPHIVWDEWAGIWISLLPVAFLLTYAPEYLSQASYWFSIVLAFVLFRLFDIAKPSPIKWADEKLSGGLGIMLDDILAGIMALVAWLMIVASILMFYPNSGY
ncbi:phosphatidylglycerophosphatase A [Psychrobacter sp. FDAARGOS_221]|uniref:phosphatidylglycerophosphatase A family protein n=1 Tax=Psychrobacter sp. FDAARGOS_221 TaxID=1975705 RepID=UPI000BB56AA7|nr:phosphatidylglycerophosphatase A [Psychrobacter sp. FDAARGOS_221]PNK60864.1 phosphatidylglycerophosphatase A [Psychrobacter sp. FDAARGOS_221]